MLRIVALVCLATVCLVSANQESSNGRIMGGSNVNINDYPFTLSFQSGGSHFCGATLISPDWAVTAAQCLSGAVTSFSLRTGSSQLESGGTVRTVTQKVAHPQFDSVTFAYDIALLKLLTPFTLGTGTGVATLPTQGQSTAAGTSAKVLGWGAKSEIGPYSSTLQMATVPVVALSNCASSYAGTNPVTNAMICAGDAGGNNGFCTGDSGGPLVVDNLLVGVTSWSVGCSRAGYPGVYTSVSAVRDWIKSVSGV